MLNCRHKYVEENVFILVLTAIIYFIPGAATLETHPSHVVCTKFRRGIPLMAAAMNWS